MLSRLAQFKEELTSASVWGSNNVTYFTKAIKFKANCVSKAMDLAGGGPLKHGGFHRLFGGHDVSDLTYWSKFGGRFGKELAKDSLTPNGIPIPGFKLFLEKGLINPASCQKWGCLNIGDLTAGTIGVIDSGLNFKKFMDDEEGFAQKSTRVLLKGALKVAVATSHGNIPLAASGMLDMGIATYSKVTEQIRIEIPIGIDALYSTLQA